MISPMMVLLGLIQIVHFEWLLFFMGSCGFGWGLASSSLTNTLYMCISMHERKTLKIFNDEPVEMEVKFQKRAL